VRQRTLLLLKQFPRNEVLELIFRVAERVLSLPLDSSLMKVLAGVELLLGKAQDWEEVAHRGVSMAEELKQLSHLISRWRKMELGSWKRLLDLKVRRVVIGLVPVAFLRSQLN